jgi:alpha-L-rhamnosidase
VDSDGNLNRTTQTAYLLALRLGLLEEAHRQKACNALREKIEQNGYRLSTGFVGTGMLNTTLSILGMDDLAYALLLQRENPSWLYSVDQGSTTVWERWDSYTKEGGFHKHPWNMNSFNHYAYGAVAEWLYAYMCGVRPGKPGFSHVILAPHADRRPADHPSLKTQPRITWARTKFNTPHGTITSEWKFVKDHYEYKFRVPKGVTYEVDIPGLQNADVVKVDRK